MLSINVIIYIEMKEKVNENMKHETKGLSPNCISSEPRVKNIRVVNLNFHTNAAHC